MLENGVIILDFGSQYTQLIARRCRELGVYGEVWRFDAPLAKIRAARPIAIILSGGPASVHARGAPTRNDMPELLSIAHVLGICYGMQLLAQTLGGKVQAAETHEYGPCALEWTKNYGDAETYPRDVWMSHGDVVTDLPKDAEVVARSANGHPAVIVGKRYWATQFHPEVAHTKGGSAFLKHFLFDVCGANANWSPAEIEKRLLAQIRERARDEGNVLCAISGGVDSTVTATLLSRALGADRVKCVFVDNGLLRAGEFESVRELYRELGIEVHAVRAGPLFMERLAGVIEPELKRKIIGATFIEVFKDAFKEVGACRYLAQGTLYPDVIESVGQHGIATVIKTHHNVGGLPKDLGLNLIEPMRELFKDEVRQLGATLGIPAKFLGRHPFPGPGLAIRILGEVTAENLEIVRAADQIFIDELRRQNLYDRVWQAFAVLLPVRTVGVQGDNRTYDRVIALRAVGSSDGMTADWYPFDGRFLGGVSGRITNGVRGVNRVVYDVTSKPPGTIEWE